MFHVKQAKSTNQEDRPESLAATGQSVVASGKTVTELAPHAELALDAGRVLAGVATSPTMGEIQWLRGFSPARSGSYGPGSGVLSARAPQSTVTSGRPIDLAPVPRLGVDLAALGGWRTDPAAPGGHATDAARPGRSAPVGEGCRGTGSAEPNGRVTDPAGPDGRVAGPAVPNCRVTGAARLNHGAPDPGRGRSEAIDLAGLSGRTSNLAARFSERPADRGGDRDDVLAAAATPSESSPDLAEPVDRALTWFASTTGAAGASEADSAFAHRTEAAGRPRDLNGPIAALTGVSFRQRKVRTLRCGPFNFLNRRRPPVEPMARSSHRPDETTQARRLPEQATPTESSGREATPPQVRPRKRPHRAV